MRCKPIVTGLVLSSIVFATVSAQAQVSIDVSKITCDQYVHDKIPTPDFASFSAVWPAPGSEDTELGVLMELEVGHGETEVYPRIQA